MSEQPHSRSQLRRMAAQQGEGKALEEALAQIKALKDRPCSCNQHNTVAMLRYDKDRLRARVSALEAELSALKTAPSDEAVREAFAWFGKADPCHYHHDPMRPKDCPTCAAWVIADYARSLSARLKEAEEKHEHSVYWYGTRFDTLRDWARGLGDKLWNEFNAIVANGSKDVFGSHEHARNYYRLKHRAEAVESRLTQALTVLEGAEKALAESWEWVDRAAPFFKWQTPGREFFPNREAIEGCSSRIGAALTTLRAFLSGKTGNGEKR